MKEFTAKLRPATRSLFLLFAGWLALLPAVGQRGITAPVNDSSNEATLLDLAAGEGKTGTWVFYTQSFVDAENKKALYNGSIYGAITSIKLNACLVDIEAEIVDLFSGTVGKQPVPQQQDSSTYSYSFPLTRELADKSEVIEARPIQLRRSTHSSCTDKPACNLTWIRVRAAQPIFQLKVVTNGPIEFQGATRQIMLPLSSSETGRRLITHLKTLAVARCH